MFGLIISTVTSFFGNNKSVIIKYAVIALVVVATLTFTYLKGHSNGVEDEQGRLSKEYAEVLEEKMKENSDRLTKEFNEKLKNQEIKVVKEIQYKEVEKVVEKIIKESPNLNKVECEVTFNEATSINSSTRRTK